MLESDLGSQDISDAYRIGESTVRNQLQKINYDIKNIEKLKRKRSNLLNRKRLILTELPAWVQEEIINLKKAHFSMGA